MGETPNDQTGQSESSEVSQADVDASVDGSVDGVDGDDAVATDAASAGQEEEASSSESAGQADIDALSQGGDDQSGDDAAGAEPAAQNAAGRTDTDAQREEAGAPADDGDLPSADGQADERLQVQGEEDTQQDSLSRPFDEEAAAMQAAAGEETAAAGSATQLPDSKSFDLPDLGDDQPIGVDAERVTMLSDVQLRVKLQLGKTRMLVEDVLKLGEGSVVELDKLAGDPIDVLVNDRLVARGEVLVLNDVFCVRVSEVIAHDPHRVTT